MLSSKEINTNLKEFASICSKINYSRPSSIIKPLKINHDFKLEIEKPTLRGIYLEEALLIKIIQYNKNKAIFRTQGRFSAKQNCFVVSCSVNSNIHKENLKRNILSALLNDYLGINGLYYDDEKRSYHQIPFLKNKVLYSQFRCLAKVSIDYCFIDLVIDKTLIDIKTDINTRAIHPYFRQAFMQSVMFSSFVKRNKVFKSNFSASEIESFEIPIDSIALYYWRSNEYFKFNLNEILDPFYMIN